MFESSSNRTTTNLIKITHAEGDGFSIVHSSDEDDADEDDDC